MNSGAMDSIIKSGYKGQKFRKKAIDETDSSGILIYSLMLGLIFL